MPSRTVLLIACGALAREVAFETRFTGLEPLDRALAITPAPRP